MSNTIINGRHNFIISFGSSNLFGIHIPANRVLNFSNRVATRTKMSAQNQTKEICDETKLISEMNQIHKCDGCDKSSYFEEENESKNFTFPVVVESTRLDVVSERDFVRGMPFHGNFSSTKKNLGDFLSKI